jgi:hypothetical protein
MADETKNQQDYEKKDDLSKKNNPTTGQNQGQPQQGSDQGGRKPGSNPDQQQGQETGNQEKPDQQRRAS